MGASHVFNLWQELPGRVEAGPYRVELVVIHEMLHTLGLGENPPSSESISCVVRAYCD